MIACYPHDDDATLYLFHTLAKKYGSDHIDKYLANGPNWVQGHLSVSRSVAAGTIVVTLEATTSTILNLKRLASRSSSFSRRWIRFRSTTPPPAFSRTRRTPTSRSFT